MQSDGTDSPGMQSLTWADSPTPDLVQPGGPRHQRVPIAGETGPGVQRELMARALAYLFAAGSLITLVLYAVLPHPEASTPGMLAVVLLALAVGVGLEIGAELIPQRAYPWVVAGGSALIGAAVYFRGSPTAAHALFYLWVACFSFYFFSRGVALAEVAFAGGTYAVALARCLAPARAWARALAGHARHAARRRDPDHRPPAPDRRDDRGALERGAHRPRSPGSSTAAGSRRPSSSSSSGPAAAATRSACWSATSTTSSRSTTATATTAATSRSSAAERHPERRQRRIDTVARLGGEEFALLVPDADDHDAYMLAERLRMSPRGRSSPSQEVPITISFGIASFPAHGESYEALLGAADDALYAAKELGRDRTVIYQPRGARAS